MAAGKDRCKFDKLSNVSEDLQIVRFKVLIFVIYMDVKDTGRSKKII